MPSLFDRISGNRTPEPDIPVCPDHDEPMRLRGKLGRPTRFDDQTEGEYQLIYFCPREGCCNTANRFVRRTQIPVPGAAPERPEFARLKDIR